MPYGTREEKTRLARNSGLWWLGALLLLLLSPLPGRLLPEDVQRTIEPKYLLILPVSALVCWVVGCSFHARSKGYPEIMGLLGVLCLPGTLLLFLLPDQWKQALDGPLRVSHLPPRQL